MCSTTAPAPGRQWPPTSRSGEGGAGAELLTLVAGPPHCPDPAPAGCWSPHVASTAGACPAGGHRALIAGLLSPLAMCPRQAPPARPPWGAGWHGESWGAVPPQMVTLPQLLPRLALLGPALHHLPQGCLQRCWAATDCCRSSLAVARLLGWALAGWRRERLLQQLLLTPWLAVWQGPAWAAAERAPAAAPRQQLLRARGPALQRLLSGERAASTSTLLPEICLQPKAGQGRTAHGVHCRSWSGVHCGCACRQMPAPQAVLVP